MYQAAAAATAAAASCCCAWVSTAAPEIACAAFAWVSDLRSYWIMAFRIALVLLALLILISAFGTQPFLCVQQNKAIAPLPGFEIALVSPRPIYSWIPHNAGFGFSGPSSVNTSFQLVLGLHFLVHFV
jgi:hypothetical protein